MQSKAVILIGGFHEIIEQVQSIGLELTGIIDNNKKGEYYGIPVYGGDREAEAILERFPESKLIITPDSGSIRKILFEKYSCFNNNFFTLISKYSIISKFSEIEDGCIISQNVHVSSGVKIGRFCKLNVGANIMHDCRIGDFSTIAPNAVILGNVEIGSNCYIGANSTILPNVKIGDDVTVGAGAVVTKDVMNMKIVKGIPAK
ncbi:acetyltransferase [Salegentibacter sp. UBA1130]|uniref:acetyltransferase n=1 Tax=Salegentibacter sp. UBA1130 TaxID=1947451 RepID=UPI00257B727A|nr:acetyltransferase [Salegentibacter sp. UBA1130]